MHAADDTSVIISKEAGDRPRTPLPGDGSIVAPHSINYLAQFVG
jgi:hypothetical protein